MSMTTSVNLRLNCDKLTGYDLLIKSHFALCNSCFWSASIINSNSRIKDCPSCQLNKLSQIPLNFNEVSRIDLV